MRRKGLQQGMNYRPLGKTGLKLSTIGFGASPLGGVYGRLDEQEGIRAVLTALDLGVNFIDVAPYYGITKAEIVLGKALKQTPRDSYYLSTKVGRYGSSDFDFSARRVVASVDESLARLNVDYVDIIFCHDIEFGSLDQMVEETIPALRGLQDSGKVRLVGVSGLPLGIFPYVAERVDLDTILSYCHYTLYDTSLESIIPSLQRKEIGIIGASPFGMGLLTGQELPAWHPATPEMRAACANARLHCQRKGVDITKLALQFSVSNPDIVTTLVGIGSPEDIIANVQAIAQPIDQQLLAEVQTILAPVRDQTWMSGRPENNRLSITQ